MKHPRLELVSFDVDGTILRGRILDYTRVPKTVHEKIVALDELFDQGRLGYEESLRLEYELFNGMRADEISPDPNRLPLIKHLGATLRKLKDAGAKVVILTDNPSFAAEPLKTRGFEDVIASEIETSEGVLTKRMRLLTNKLQGLGEYCGGNGIQLARCAHVGDWVNDIVAFKGVGLSVALNPSRQEVSSAATYTVKSDSMLDVFRALESNLLD